LWAEESGRFGRLTQIRFGAAAGKDLATTAAEFERELARRISPESMGLAFEPVKARAIAPARGSTDFSMLFMSFSMFLILSARCWSLWCFGSGGEAVPGNGILLAVGLRPRSVATVFLWKERFWRYRAVVGLAGAAGYARLLLTGLSSWWADAAVLPLFNCMSAEQAC